MKALLKPTRLVTFIAMIFIMLTTKAQEFTAGINTETPNPNAVLHLVSPNGNQGLLVPTLTNAQRNAMSLTATDNGLMVFDTDDNGFYFWASPNWILMSNTDQQDLANVLSQANDAGANQIKNVADPTDPQDVATKFYVDNLPSQDPVSTDAGNIIVSGGDGGAFLGNVDFANVINLPTTLDLDNTDDITLTTIPAVGDISGDYSNGFQIDPGVVTTLEITDGTIANADLDADAVQSGNILDGTITDADIGDVTAGKVTGLGTAATLNVGTADGDVVQVQSGGFLPALNGANLTGVTATIAANSITNTELGPDAVQTGNILDGTITDADISDLSYSKLVGIPTDIADGDDVGIAVEADPVWTGDRTILGSAGTINTPSNLVDWTQLKSVPADFADGTDDVGIISEADPVWTGDRTILGSAGTINTPSNLVDWTQLKSVPADFADGTDDVGIISEADPVWTGDRTILGSAGTINTPSNLVDWSQLKSVPADFADGTDDVGIISEADPVWTGDRTILGSAGTINTPSNLVDWTQLKSVPADFADGTDDIGIVSEADPVWIADRTTLGSAAGTINTPSNIVDWSQLKSVPAGFADGVDDGIVTETQTLANVIALGNDAGGSIISNVLDPAGPQDVATRNYVDSQGFITGETQTLANVIALSNDAGGSIISNVLDPAAAQDVATRNYVDSQGFITGETQTLANVIALSNDAGGSIISNVLDPAAAQDVATRNYVDSQGFITGETQTLANVIALSNDAGGSIISNVLDPAAAQDVATRNYVDSQGFITGETQTLANVIALSNDAGGSTISNVLDPAAAQDVATRNYVDSQGFITGETQTLANVIALSNDAGGSIISNVLDPAAAQDVATRNYVDSQGFITGETQTLANVIALGNDAGGSIITNVLDPAAAQDVATKNYVDTGISSVTLTTGNGITVASPNINLGGTLTAAATITTGAGSNDLIIDGAGEFVTNTAIATSLNSATINLGNEAADNINVRGGITFVEATQNLALDVTDQSAAGSVLNLPDLAGNTETIALLSDLTPGVVSEPNATSIVGGTGASGGTGANNTVYGLDAGNGLSSGANNVLIGRNAANGGTPLASGNGNTIIGSGAITTGGVTGNGVAIGHQAEVGSSNAIAIGFNSTATGLRSVAVGANTTASIDGTLILGDGLAANSTYNVGIGTDNPRSSLQIGGELGISHFENATEDIFGDAIFSNVYPDYSDAVDNQLRRTNTDSVSFIFFDDGEITFLNAPNGAANSIVDISMAGDVKSWMRMRNDGNVTIDEGVQIGSPDPGEEEDGMLRFNGSGFEGYFGGGWNPLGGGGVSGINSDITFANGTNRQIRIEDGGGGNSLTVSPGTGLSVDGGALILNGGGSDNNAGGDVDINGGSSPGDGGSVTIDGANGNGGGGTGLGGAITLRAGDGAALSGDGGPISITAGSTLSSGGDTAGDVTITAGNGGGTSGGGDVRLNAGTSGSGTDGAIIMNGHVGIGTNLPRREFHLNGAGGISFQMTNAASGSANPNTGFVIDYNDTDQTVDFRHYEDQNIAFGSSGTRNLYIDNVNGRVGIGTTTPGSTLEVNGDVSVGGQFTRGLVQITAGNTLRMNGTPVIDVNRNMSPNSVTMEGELISTPSVVTTSTDLASAIPPQRVIRVNMDADITNLPVGVPGREIILIATQGSAQVQNGGNIRLNQDMAFVMNPGSSLHLIFMDAPIDAWVEISRSATP